MKTFRICLLPALLTLLLFSGCQDKDQIARLRVTLVDDEGDYDEVNVDIQGVAVHTNEHANVDANGWIVFENSDVGVKNLLDYTGGIELTLVDTEFPAGRISQIRLILGEHNTLKLDGWTEAISLETPSAEQSGLKLQVHEVLNGGITYEFKLDFDAALSIVHLTGEGKYILSPVLSVTTDVLSGAIKGRVTPADEQVAGFLQQGGVDVLSTFSQKESGEFLFADVDEGQYTLIIKPGENSIYEDYTENVEVILGEVTDVGEIILLEK